MGPSVIIKHTKGWISHSAHPEKIVPSENFGWLCNSLTNSKITKRIVKKLFKTQYYADASKLIRNVIVLAKYLTFSEKSSYSVESGVRAVTVNTAS